MRKFIIILATGMLWCNVGFAENFLKLKSLDQFIYGKDSADFVCYDMVRNGKNAFKYRINFLNKNVNQIKKNILEYDKGTKASLEQSLKFDKSSSKYIINFLDIRKKDGKNFYLFNNFNLKTLEFTSNIFDEWHLGTYDVKKSDIEESIKKSEAFKILKNFKIKTAYPIVFDCAIYWEDQLIEKEDSFFIEILEEASKLSKIEKCKGIGKLGPGDPSLNWNNCIGYKNMKNKVYIGDFVDGSYSGQGIMFNFIEGIYVGYFKDDVPHGKITSFSQAYHFSDATDPGKSKSWVISGEFNNGQPATQPKFTEFKFR